MSDDLLQQWRVLCTDASLILRHIDETHNYDVNLCEEWQRRYARLAAVNDAERERVDREQFRPCAHCATYEDVLAVERENADLHSRGMVRLGWPCCGAPLGFETQLERETREAMGRLRLASLNCGEPQ